MSYLSQCLSLLGFTNVGDVTTISLKVAYRKAVLETHPDKGGSEDEFDKLLSAFVFLANMFKFRKRNLNIGSLTKRKRLTM